MIAPASPAPFATIGRCAPIAWSSSAVGAREAHQRHPRQEWGDVPGIFLDLVVARTLLLSSSYPLTVEASHTIGVGLELEPAVDVVLDALVALVIV